MLYQLSYLPGRGKGNGERGQVKKGGMTERACVPARRAGVAVSLVVPGALLAGPVAVAGGWWRARGCAPRPFLVGVIASWGGLVVGALGAALTDAMMEVLDGGRSPHLREFFGPSLGIGEFIVASAALLFMRRSAAGWNNALAFGIGVASGPALMAGAMVLSEAMNPDPQGSPAGAFGGWDVARLWCMFLVWVLSVAQVWMAIQRDDFLRLVCGFALLVCCGTAVGAETDDFTRWAWPVVGVDALALLVLYDRRERGVARSSGEAGTIAA